MSEPGGRGGAWTEERGTSEAGGLGGPGRRLKAPRRRASKIVLRGKLPDDLDGGDPGLRLLLRSLAGAPTPDELTGEHAALVMFRTAHRPLASARAGDAVDASVSRRSRRAPTRNRPARRAAWLAAATTIALFGGFTAAGYVAALPAPVQQFAHRLLGFVGVPDHGRSGQPGGPAGRAALPARQRISPRSASPGHARPTLTPGPSATAPPVSVSLRTDGHRARAVLIVSCPLAKRGDVVQLQRRSADGWNTLRKRRIGQVRQVKFTVPIGKASVEYRILLPATAYHGSASKTVTVAGRPHPGRRHRG